MWDLRVTLFTLVVYEEFTGDAKGGMLLGDLLVATPSPVPPPGSGGTPAIFFTWSSCPNPEIVSFHKFVCLAE